MKPYIVNSNPCGKHNFSVPKTRIVAASVFLAILAILIFIVPAPLLLSNHEEKQSIQAPDSTLITGPIKKSANYQSIYNWLTSPFQVPQSITVYGATHPQAILSLEGTFGDKGWYISNVTASLYATGDNSESLTTEYAFYNQGWKTYTEPFVIFEEGQTAIYYRVRDVSGYVGDTRFQTVDIDKTPPNGSALIEKGAKDAFSTLVNLTLTVTDAPSGPATHPPSGYLWGVPSGPADMRLSNDGALWSPWEPISNETTWTLETGAGVKTVYVQARDNAGLVSEPFSDTINLVTSLDSVAPVTKIIVNGKKDFSGVYTSAVAITLSALDDLSGISLTEYSFDSQTWIKYTAPLPIYTQGETTIYYRSIDAEGNLESPNSYTITISKSEDSDLFAMLITIGIVASVTAVVMAIVLMRRKRHAQNQKLADAAESTRA